VDASTHTDASASPQQQQSAPAKNQIHSSGGERKTKKLAQAKTFLRRNMNIALSCVRATAESESGEKAGAMTHRVHHHL
jgi:hypothetical protein